VHPKNRDVLDLLRNVVNVNQFNAGILILRVIFGLFLAYHGYNKFFGPGGLAAAVLREHGMRWPRQHVLPPRRSWSAAWW
jgi:uncharacterized membrane protein YphA (DoxX/SURF4 family)